jgi:sugar/nucleoside kinase (ribokinase family)
MVNYQIYAVGAALVDTEVTVSDQFLKQHCIEKGVMTLVEQSRQLELLAAIELSGAHQLRKSGGSACNSIVAAAEFGATTCFAGKVAEDSDGELFIRDLNDAGVRYQGKKSQTDITGKCLVMVTDDAERTMNTYLGASEQFTESEIDQSVLVNSEWFYIEGYLLTDNKRTQVVQAAVALAKQQGVRVALSLSDPFVAQIFADNLRAIIGDGIDLIFCNKDEALAFTQTESVEQAGETLKQSAKTYAITDGANGAMVFDGQSNFSVPAVQANAIDTNGAGDMFAGAFLYAITAGADYAAAARLANLSASKVVERFGPRLESQDFKQLMQLWRA